MEKSVKSTPVRISEHGKGLIPKVLSKKQANFIKIAFICLLVFAGFVHFLPRALELAPEWVKHFFKIYLFLWVLPRGLFKLIDAMRVEK